MRGRVEPYGQRDLGINPFAHLDVGDNSINELLQWHPMEWKKAVETGLLRHSMKWGRNVQVKCNNNNTNIQKASPIHNWMPSCFTNVTSMHHCKAQRHRKEKKNSKNYKTIFMRNIRTNTKITNNSILLFESFRLCVILWPRRLIARVCHK